MEQLLLSVLVPISWRCPRRAVRSCGIQEFQVLAIGELTERHSFSVLFYRLIDSG